MNGFQLELHHLKQKDGSGGDTGEPITTFANHTFSLSSFNRMAEIQGKPQGYVYNFRVIPVLWLSFVCEWEGG